MIYFLIMKLTHNYFSTGCSKSRADNILRSYWCCQENIQGGGASSLLEGCNRYDWTHILLQHRKFLCLSNILVAEHLAYHECSPKFLIIGLFSNWKKIFCLKLYSSLLMIKKYAVHSQTFFIHSKWYITFWGDSVYCICHSLNGVIRKLECKV